MTGRLELSSLIFKVANISATNLHRFLHLRILDPLANAAGKASASES
jgi:hypothetical protein